MAGYPQQAYGLFQEVELLRADGTWQRGHVQAVDQPLPGDITVGFQCRHNGLMSKAIPAANVSTNLKALQAAPQMVWRSKMAGAQEWVDYPLEIQRKMEDAWRYYETASIRFEIAGNLFDVDFRTMQQKNILSPDKVRTVIRTEIDAKASDGDKIAATFDKGEMGSEISPEDGVVNSVYPGGQAAKWGVQRGWVVRKVDGEAYSWQALENAWSRGVEYVVEFSRPKLTRKNSRLLHRQDSREMLLRKLRTLQAVENTFEEVKTRLETFVDDFVIKNGIRKGDESDAFLRTLHKVQKIMKDGAGGTIIAVLHENVLQEELRFDMLDHGIHTEVFRAVAKDIHHDEKNFVILLDALTAHSESDRWEAHDLEELVKQIPAIGDFWDRLIRQPKDGAILVGHRGSVKGVALHLKYASSMFQLKKAGGKSAGTRHANTLGFTEWLGGLAIACAGVAFARSDGGGAHALIPTDVAPFPPDILHFDTLKLPTNDDMLELFKTKMMTAGKIFQKVQPVLIRAGKAGERVITLIDGVVTSNIMIPAEVAAAIGSREPSPRPGTPAKEKEDIFVVRSVHVERTLTQRQVTNIYQWPGIPLDKVSPADKLWLQKQEPDLIEKGFKLHRPSANELRYIFTLEAEDLARLGRPVFRTKFGDDQMQPLKVGDHLAMKCLPKESMSKSLAIYVIHMQDVKEMQEIDRANLPPGY